MKEKRLKKCRSWKLNLSLMVRIDYELLQTEFEQKMKMHYEDKTLEELFDDLEISGEDGQVEGMRE